MIPLKKIYIISIAVVLIAAISIPIIITQINRPEPTDEDTESPVILDYYPKDFVLYSGIVTIGMESQDNSGSVTNRIYIDSVLVATNETYNWDTTVLPDGTEIEVLFKAEDESGNTATETVQLAVDNFINPARTDVFKFMTYNIWESGETVTGYNGETRPKGRWKNVVEEENPDICVLVETGSLDNSDNYELLWSIDTLNRRLYDEAPYDGRCDQGIPAYTDGEAIISRYPIINFTQIEEYRLDDDTIHYYHHDFFDTVIDIQGIQTHVIGYHGKCCNNTGEEPPERQKEVEGILNYLDDLGDVPIIWAGDFNAFSPVDTADPELAPMGNLGDEPLTMILFPEDPTWGQYSSKVHNFTDCYRTLNPDEKGYSFGYWETYYWSRIDFIIANQHWADKIINSTVADTPSADLSSDHYCVDCFFSLDENYSYSNPIVKVSKQTEIESKPTSITRLKTAELNYEIVVINIKKIHILL